MKRTFCPLVVVGLLLLPACKGASPWGFDEGTLASDDATESDSETQSFDSSDICPTDPNKTEPGACGCRVPENCATTIGLSTSKPSYSSNESIQAQCRALRGASILG